MPVRYSRFNLLIAGIRNISNTNVNQILYLELFRHPFLIYLHRLVKRVGGMSRANHKRAMIDINYIVGPLQSPHDGSAKP
jgi:hypothetical protein